MVKVKNKSKYLNKCTNLLEFLLDVVLLFSSHVSDSFVIFVTSAVKSRWYYYRVVTPPCILRISHPDSSLNGRLSVIMWIEWLFNSWNLWQVCDL